ncbi:MAG: 2-phosphosulfolactate phosphatase [Gaiellaceae bacterium]
MRVRVAFTPQENVATPLAIAVDVLRATSTICQALAGGYEEVVCVPGIDEARAHAARDRGVALAGERGCVRVDGFDFGNSPREFVNGAPAASRLVLTTTNGTRLLLAAAARCETVLVGSLLNLRALVDAARASGTSEVAILCAGVEGEFALDDAYCAGRIAEALGGEPADSAEAAIRLSTAFASHEDALGASTSAVNLRVAGLDDDIAWCAQESLLGVVPRIVARTGDSVRIACA